MHVPSAKFSKTGATDKLNKERQVCLCAYAWTSWCLIQVVENFLQIKEKQKDNLENTPTPFIPPPVLLLAIRQYSLHAPLHSLLSLSLVVFCVMEWLLRTWLPCLTLVDEVCLCLSALTCRNRDTAYSKINTQSRRERGLAREVEKRREREEGCLKVDEGNETEGRERGWSRKSLERKRKRVT